MHLDRCPWRSPGSMDDVAIWSVALASSQVLSLFNANVRPDFVSDNLVAWYTFDAISTGPITAGGVFDVHGSSNIALPNGFSSAGTIVNLAVSNAAPFLHSAYIPPLTDNELFLDRRAKTLATALASTQAELAAALINNSTSTSDISNTTTSCQSFNLTRVPFSPSLLPLTTSASTTASCAVDGAPTPLHVSCDTQIFTAGIIIPPPLCGNMQAYLPAASPGAISLPPIKYGERVHSSWISTTRHCVQFSHPLCTVCLRAVLSIHTITRTNTLWTNAKVFHERPSL